MEVFLPYLLPAVGLFLLQACLCLWCENRLLRMLPTLIAFAITAYHIGMILCNLDDLWVGTFALAYLTITILPSLVGVGLGWVVYVVRLMVQTVSDFRKSQ